MHYKNRKPKRHKGCCALCAMLRGNGYCRGRELTMPERRAELSEREQRVR